MRNRNNTLFKKIKKDFSGVLAILTQPSGEDFDNGLDSIKYSSSEDAEIIKELKESEEKLKTYASEYEKSIGVSSKARNNSKSTNKRNSTIDNTPINNKEISDTDRDIER